MLLFAGFISSAPSAAVRAPMYPAETGSPQLQEGQHDFDFNVGVWKTHIRRLQHPLTGSTTWVELNGAVIVRKIWDGRGQFEEIEADGTGGHFEGLTLFLYNPQSRQWSLYFANSTDAVLNTPSVGEFRDGRGEFYDQETYNGRAIFVRIVWSDVTPDSHRFEQSFSNDGGKTWEPNFVATLTRDTEAGDDPKSRLIGDEPAENHGFDFELGSWNIHLHKLQGPLTGSREWVDFDGTSVTQKVWSGRGQLEQFETNGAAGHIEGLTLRLFNPKSHQWRLYWANSRTGTVGIPTVGAFKNGVGEFYDQEDFNGREILVRYVWSKLDSPSPHFEQSFSDDGGKTWEVNWITDQSHAKDRAK